MDAEQRSAHRCYKQSDQVIQVWHLKFGLVFVYTIASLFDYNRFWRAHIDTPADQQTQLTIKWLRPPPIVWDKVDDDAEDDDELLLLDTLLLAAPSIMLKRSSSAFGPPSSSVPSLLNRWWWLTSDSSDWPKSPPPPGRTAVAPGRCFVWWWPELRIEPAPLLPTHWLGGGCQDFVMLRLWPSISSDPWWK